MKRVLLLCLVVVFLAGFAGISYASFDETFEVAIVNTKGFIEVDETGRGVWGPAIVGAKLKTGAVIKTGSDGVVDIVYDAEGLNVVRITENTQVTVEKSMMDLYDGKVLADFRNLAPGSEFQVKTPNTICGIRGSGCMVEFLRALGFADVSAFYGSVYVQGRDARGNLVGGEVPIPVGWWVRVVFGGDVSVPRGISENARLAWYAFLRNIGGEEAGALAQLGALLEESGRGVYGKDLDDVKDEAAVAAEEKKPCVSP